MKKLILFALLFLIPTTVFACFDIDPYSWKKTTDKIVDIPTETELYNTESELKDASDLVIIAEWTGARKTVEINENIGTSSQIKILSVVKGSKTLKGKKINILEPAYQYEGILNRYDGYDFMQPKKKYKLFLKKVKNNYIITGTIQGKKEL